MGIYSSTTKVKPKDTMSIPTNSEVCETKSEEPINPLISQLKIKIPKDDIYHQFPVLGNVYLEKDIHVNKLRTVYIGHYDRITEDDICDEYCIVKHATNGFDSLILSYLHDNVPDEITM